MGKIAFLYSGQGDQYRGMGEVLCAGYPAAAAVFQICESLRPGTMTQCFSGTDEELMETANTQPCLFSVELAMTAVLREHGVSPDAYAGFSLGEVAAATAAGLFSLEDGFRAVCQRGVLMQREADRFDTSMAAVVKLAPETVRSLCAAYTEVYPVNFNCPGQITVSGSSAQMPDFFADVKAAGGRAIPLKVKGAFHSPFMAEASAAFAKVLEEMAIGEHIVPLYSNVTAEPYAGDAAALLAKQICSPVQWESIIRHMIASGIDTFIEIGPGKTLTNMMKKIDGGVKALAAADIAAVLAEVGSC